MKGFIEGMEENDELVVSDKVNKDDTLSSTCDHQTFETRYKMNIVCGFGITKRCTRNLSMAFP